MKLALPFDGSPAALRAVDYVLGLAARNDERTFEVHLLNVQEANAGIVEFFAHYGADAGSKLANSCREAGTKLLAAPLGALQKANVATESVVLIGEPADVIAAYVDNNRCDAIVMGTRGLGSVGGLVLGSVATKVIHLTKVPVTLVK